MAKTYQTTVTVSRDIFLIVRVTWQEDIPHIMLNVPNEKDEVDSIESYRNVRPFRPPLPRRSRGLQIRRVSPNGTICPRCGGVERISKIGGKSTRIGAYKWRKVRNPMASGDRPNTDRKPSGKKAEKLSQKEQSERFKETARELGSDETGKEFERLLDKIVIRPRTERL